MNDFNYIGADEIGQLTQIQMNEVFVDTDKQPARVTSMTKEQYKEKQRQERIANNGAGDRIGKLVRGEVVPNFDNSEAWKLREQIAGEIAPEIRRRQLAWANQA